MPSGRSTNLTITIEAKNRIEAKWEQLGKPDMYLSRYLSKVLLNLLDFEEKQKKYGPFLELVDRVDDHLLVRDTSSGNDFIADIKINSAAKRLECYQCHTDNCKHIGLCFADRTTYEVLIQNGFREPRK